MSRISFAILAVAGSSLVLFLAASSWWGFIQTDSGDALDVLLPGIFWLASTAALIPSCPLWLYLVYEPWRDFKPASIRNLLLLPLFFALATFGMVLAGFLLFGYHLLMC